MRRAAGVALTAGVLFTRALAAQADCFPATNSHEARTLAIMSLPLVFSAVRAPAGVPRPTVTAGLEASYVPEPDAVTRTPTVCRPGKGPEETALLFAVPRPRFGVALPGGLSVEASWIPPIRINGVKANLVGFAVGETMHLGRAWVAVRAHATLGVIHAPVTCNTDALADPVSECFNGTRSNDSFHPNIFGADAAIGWPVSGGQLRPYVGAGYNLLHPRFQVHFTNSQGSTDTRKVEVNLRRGVLFGGLTWAAAAAWEVSGEVYAAPGDAVTARVALRAALGS